MVLVGDNNINLTLKEYLQIIRNIKKREDENLDIFKNYAINESFYKCVLDRATIFNDYIDLLRDAIGLHTLNRTQLLELLKEMKWEL